MSENSLGLITASQLSKYLESTSLPNSTLLIDCRPFTGYNTGHITGAHNIYCPPILKRRCTDGIPLHYIVRATEAREALLTGEVARVVLYDESSLSSEALGGSSDIHLAVATLEKSREKSFSIQLLKGGFDTFSLLYGNLCTWSGSPSGLSGGCLSGLSSPVMGGHYLTVSHGSSQSLTGPLSAGRQPPVAPFRNVLNMWGKSERSNSENICKDEDGPNEIRPWLYLGTMKQASRNDRLTSLGITALLNVAAVTASPQEDLSATCRATDQRPSPVTGGENGPMKTSRKCPEVPPWSPGAVSGKFCHLSIPLRDNATADISCWFPQCIKFIEEARRLGGKVLVHCQAGISRSATICIAYLMQMEGLTMETAHDHVKSRRSIIAPNLNFMRQLYEFESQLRRRHLATVTALATPRFTRSPRRCVNPPGTACLPTLSPPTPDSLSARGSTSLFVFDGSSPPAEVEVRRLRTSYPVLPQARYYYRQFVPTSSFISPSYGNLLKESSKSARTVEKSCCMFDLSTGSVISPVSRLCPPIIPSQ